MCPSTELMKLQRMCKTNWIKRMSFGCWAPCSRDTQEAVEKRSREEPVGLSATVGLMLSWFQNSVLLTLKLGPSLILSGSSFRKGNDEQSWSSKSSIASPHFKKKDSRVLKTLLITILSTICKGSNQFNLWVEGWLVYAFRIDVSAYAFCCRFLELSVAEAGCS